MKTKNVETGIIASFQVETKKGNKQAVNFLISKNIIYPRIKDFCWGNDDNVLISSYGSAPTYKLKNEYTCVLLADGIDFDNIPNSRLSHAGFTDYSYDYKTKTRKSETLPGTIVYRGNDLGEMSIELIERPSHYIEGPEYIMNTRFCGNTYTPGEKKFIQAQIIPVLSAAIDKNKDVLNSIAIDQVKARMIKQIEEGKKALDKLETEMMEKLEKLS